LVYLGTISYGLYLFHRPIARAVVDLGLGGNLAALALIATASVAIAAISYRYVELPVLGLKRRATPAVHHHAAADAVPAMRQPAAG
jgi:peptidoglycan/LPS O-acetylase OafA/YrhL